MSITPDDLEAWRRELRPDSQHDPRPGSPAPLVLDEPTCHAYRNLAGRLMQQAIYVTECPTDAAQQFADAWSWRAEFDAPPVTEEDPA